MKTINFTLALIANQIFHAVKQARKDDVVIVQPELWDVIMREKSVHAPRIIQMAQNNGVVLIKGDTPK
jgi:hypothetical protein